MSYVYKFYNNSGEVVYVGRTSRFMKQRMGEHFSGHGHLPLECYSSTEKVEFIRVSTKTESEIIELYLINTIRPVFNTQKKEDSPISIVIDESHWDWKVYEGHRDRDFYVIEKRVSDLYRLCSEKTNEIESLKEVEKGLREDIKKVHEDKGKLQSKIIMLSSKLSSMKSPVHKEDSSLNATESIELKLWDIDRFEKIYDSLTMEDVYFEGNIKINDEIFRSLHISYENGVIIYRDNDIAYTKESLKSGAFNQMYFNMVGSNGFGFKTNADKRQLQTIKEIISRQNYEQSM